MKLYGYWRSSATWRVRIALALKNLPHEIVPVHLLKDGGEQHSEAHRKRNAMAQLPVLEITHVGHTEFLSQSLAIIDYLEALQPQPALFPAQPYLRARALQFAELVNAGIQPLQNTFVTNELKSLGVDERKFVHGYITRGLHALAESAAPVAGKFLVGDEISIADVCLVPQLYGARRFDVDLAEWPLLTRVENACMELPAFVAAHADRQPDAVKT